MKKVLVFGSFDLMHQGHYYFLESAKKLGDKLIVVIARDDTIRKIKKHQPKFSEKERVKHVRQTLIPNKIILGMKGDKLKVIEKINPDIIAIGYDQNSFNINLKHKLKQRGLNPKIIKLKAYKTHKYKSSKLKKKK